MIHLNASAPLSSLPSSSAFPAKLQVSGFDDASSGNTLLEYQEPCSHYWYADHLCILIKQHSIFATTYIEYLCKQQLFTCFKSKFMTVQLSSLKSFTVYVATFFSPVKQINDITHFIIFYLIAELPMVLTFHNPQICLPIVGISLLSESRRTHLFPLPALSSPTLHPLEQNLSPHFLHSGKLTPFIPQTLHTTCFVKALDISAAARTGSIGAMGSEEGSSKGSRRRVRDEEGGGWRWVWRWGEVEARRMVGRTSE